jgi:hypothetical protein
MVGEEFEEVTVRMGLTKSGTVGIVTMSSAILAR